MDGQEMNEFNKMICDTDISTFSLEDQIRIMHAWEMLVTIVKPIYIKNLIKSPEVSTFIIKL